MRHQDELQKALHEAVCEASDRKNRAVAAVRLISGKICSFESSDRHRRGHDLKKTRNKKSDAKIDRTNKNMTAPRSAGRRPKVLRSYVSRCASDVAD